MSRRCVALTIPLESNQSRAFLDAESMLLKISITGFGRRKTDGFVSHRSGSIVITITRTNSTTELDIEDCKARFEDMIEHCTAEKNLIGGTILTEEFMYEVYDDISQITYTTCSDDSDGSTLELRSPEDEGALNEDLKRRKAKKSQTKSTKKPTKKPSKTPAKTPTKKPTKRMTKIPTKKPSKKPTV